MDNATMEQAKKATEEMMQAQSCSPEAKAAGEKWLAALGTPNEKAETEAYLNELRDDVRSVDALITFAMSPDGLKIFGEQGAKTMVSKARDAKMMGGKYCICDACQAGAKVLELKDKLLA